MTTLSDDIQIKIKSINEGHMAILSRQEEILIETAVETHGMTQAQRAAHACGYILAAKHEEAKALAFMDKEKTLEGIEAWKRAEALFAKANAASILV